MDDISVFCLVTNTGDHVQAKRFLELANEDLNLAISLFMENGDQNDHLSDYNNDRSDHYYNGDYGNDYDEGGYVGGGGNVGVRGGFGSGGDFGVGGAGVGRAGNGGQSGFGGDYSVGGNSGDYGLSGSGVAQSGGGGGVGGNNNVGGVGSRGGHGGDISGRGGNGGQSRQSGDYGLSGGQSRQSAQSGNNAVQGAQGGGGNYSDNNNVRLPDKSTHETLVGGFTGGGFTGGGYTGYTGFGVGDNNHFGVGAQTGSGDDSDVGGDFEAQGDNNRFGAQGGDNDDSRAQGDNNRFNRGSGISNRFGNLETNGNSNQLNRDLSNPNFNSNPNLIFGRTQESIFNQRFGHEIWDVDDDDEEEVEFDDDGSDDDVIIIDDDEGESDYVNSGSGFPQQSNNFNSRVSNSFNSSSRNTLNSNQKRLANLFRPPFDLITAVDLDTAKILGKKEKKWILINIQNPTFFQSQVLNRDFWSNSRIKNLVSNNFIFLQYQHDSPNGINYVNFYKTDNFPHIAILDSLTGERLKFWIDGEVPNIREWCDDVEEFLTDFSLNPNAQNPIINHKFDPDLLTEEQQIEFAIKHSLSGNKEEEKQIVEEIPKDSFEAIIPTNHTEPDSSSSSTRIQIRFPNGKRLVHKFLLTDNIEIIYKWLKFVISQDSDLGLESDYKFILTNSSDRGFKFIESLDKTIDEANLKNASILLEKD